MLAVLLTVIVPLLLLFLSFQEKTLLARLLAYWRVSALLAISVYLLMAELTVGLVTGVVARALIPPVLWLGDGLMQSSHNLANVDSPLHKTFRTWRWTVSLYCVLGVAFTVPLLSCAWTGQVTEMCSDWFAPPQVLGSLLHQPDTWPILGKYALIALGIYFVYLLMATAKLGLKLLR